MFKISGTLTIKRQNTFPQKVEKHTCSDQQKWL